MPGSPQTAETKNGPPSPIPSDLKVQSSDIPRSPGGTPLYVRIRSPSKRLSKRLSALHSDMSNALESWKGLADPPTRKLALPAHDKALHGSQFLLWHQACQRLASMRLGKRLLGAGVWHQ